ncbi:putative disease resistance protein At3g14460 [Tripterygium wilfordii]|uniref:putative disease resistance protein At3g14460 n=1 Tax=Tripterygium wilfordii TaxID=458696 RepID=UPI0018F80F2E|nr:putative disease resistance protein At3g14460 [Tripterygium wilfordii]
MYKRSKVEGTSSSQTSSVGIPVSWDSVDCGSISSIANPYTPNKMEFVSDPEPAASAVDVMPDNEFLVLFGQNLRFDNLELDNLSLPFAHKSVNLSAGKSAIRAGFPRRSDSDDTYQSNVRTTDCDQSASLATDLTFPLAQDLKSYFSLFPLDYEFDKDSLIQLWIAEGFIMNESTTLRMEDLGSLYFSRLLDEGFIVTSGYYHSCDKFKYKVDEAKTGERLMFDGNKLDDIPASSRRLSLRCMDINHRTSVAIKKCELLSTLLLFPHHGSCIKHIPRDIFLSLKGLLVLNLSQLDILEIPSSIGGMTSLLYLDVSETPIKWLPESVGCLQKLQTLKLRCCFNLLGLPKATKKLINLRHLDLDVVSQLNSMPASLGCLINLQTLSAFIIGEYDGCRIGELKNMSNLSGEFCLVRLENVVNSKEAIEAALWEKRYIQKLELNWSDSCSETINEQEEILEHLRPHKDLQELKINFYSGSKLPSWISSPSYFNLVSISFYKCINCQFLPSIGTLPSLKFLYINEMNCVKEISQQFFKNNNQGQVVYAFPKLEKLSIDVMLGLEEWKEIELGDLPCLLKLTMQCCPELVTLPSFAGLDSLKHLEIIDCPKLPSLPEGLPTSLEFLLVKDCPILKERCNSESGEDWQKVSHVPHIWIDLEEISSVNSKC